MPETLQPGQLSFLHQPQSLLLLHTTALPQRYHHDKRLRLQSATGFPVVAFDIEHNSASRNSSPILKFYYVRFAVADKSCSLCNEDMCTKLLSLKVRSINTSPGCTERIRSCADIRRICSAVNFGNIFSIRELVRGSPLRALLIVIVSSAVAPHTVKTTLPLGCTSFW